MEVSRGQEEAYTLSYAVMWSSVPFESSLLFFLQSEYLIMPCRKRGKDIKQLFQAGGQI